MQNKYTADATFPDAEGKTYTVRLDYEARAAIRSAFGKSVSDAAAEAINAATQEDNLDPLSRLLAILLQRHHPGTVASDVLKMSPPVGVTIAAVQNTILWSMWGEKGPPQDAGANPPSPATP
jgi:hypothetical protein